MNQSYSFMHDIDVVITWVDGNDPAHLAKRLKHQANSSGSHPAASLATRFDSRGEIYICIASILKFLPFVRTIWVVTDNQSPEHLDKFAKLGLCAEDKIRIVDHTEILGDVEAALPTFNSLSIETALWRIKGLASHFIYFNDDMFVNKPLAAETFFEGGLPIIHGHFVPPNHKRLWIRLRRFLRKITGRKPRYSPSFRVAQELGARQAGKTDSFVLSGHWPHPMRQQTFAKFFEANWDVFERQVSHRFRSVSQLWSVTLATHLENRPEILPPPKLAYLKPYRSRAKLERSIDDALANEAVFGCMQSLDRVPQDACVRLYTGLQEKFADALPIDLMAVMDPSSDRPTETKHQI